VTLAPRLVERGSARIDVWAEARNVVRIHGVMREPAVGDWLLPLIDEIHGTARAEHLQEIVLDIQELEYANAAVWRCLVHWVRRVRQQGAAPYSLRIVSNPECSWQRIGVPSLRPFSLDTNGAPRLILEGTSS
jgi:hypothetical protein